MAIVVLALSVVLQAVAAGLALRLTRTTAQRTAWLLIALAIGLMAVRRGLTLGEVLIDGGSPDLASELVALAISLLMVTGVAMIRPLFTSLRSTQDALADTEGRYRGLFQQSPVAVLELDWSALRAALVALPAEPPVEDQLVARPALVERLAGLMEVVGVNRAAIELFEGADAAAIARSLQGLVTSSRPTDSIVRSLVAVARGQAQLEVERAITTLRGTRREVVVRWNVLPGSEVSYAHVVVSFVDVTERQRIQAQLMVTDRMVALGTLAAGVAHEINNPLTYVLANLQLVAGKDEAERARLVAGAIEGAERVRDIVRDLQSFSRGRDAPAGPVALAAAIDAATRIADHELRHRARLVRDVDPGLYVTADSSRLGQVVLNVLVNAAQSIPPGDVEHNEIRIGAEAAGDRVVVTIADTGAGIPAELLPHVFEPFVTSRAAGGGTGLGLYLCDNIMRSLGGDITVESRPGEGSRFHLGLPRAAAPAVAAPAAAPAPAPGGLAILIVDDEKPIRDVLARVLSRHQVRVVASGRAAIAAVDEHAFDVILCDLMMPDLTGMDVYEHVRAHHPELVDRIVFLSGGAFTEASQAFLADPTRRHLAKPFRIDDVLAVVAEAARARAART